MAITKKEAIKVLDGMEYDLLNKKDGYKEQTSEDKRHGDILDHAARMREQEMALLISVRDREKLHKIGAARERIEEGEYGICEDCGEDIEEGRMRAIPLAVQCISCKEVEEKEKGRS